MLQYETMNGGLGISEMINTLVNKTWKAPRLTGMQGLIQLQTEQVLLTYLLAASVNDNNSFLVQAQFLQSLKDLRKYISGQVAKATTDIYKGHLALALERMNNPTTANPTLHEEAPPGSPIGEDDY